MPLADCNLPFFYTRKKLVQPFAECAAGNWPGIGVSSTVEKVAGVDICDLKILWPLEKLGNASSTLFFEATSV